MNTHDIFRMAMLGSDLLINFISLLVGPKGFNHSAAVIFDLWYAIVDE